MGLLSEVVLIILLLVQSHPLLEEIPIRVMEAIHLSEEEQITQHLQITPQYQADKITQHLQAHTLR